MNIFQLNLEIFRQIYKKIYGQNISKIVQCNMESPYEGKESPYQEKIKRYIIPNRPLMMARFGTYEFNAFVNYLQVENELPRPKYSAREYIRDNTYPNWYSLSTKKFLKNNAGFFPTNDKYLAEWGRLVFNDLSNLDVLFSWMKNEELIDNLLVSVDKISNYEMYYPYKFLNPWTEALRHKKVLVISPFSKLIEKQYHENRTRLFKNPKVLPDFELKTITAYNVLRGVNCYPNISSWFDALHDMEAQMEKIDFDIALIGCGAYAFNLAAYAKRMGKVAVTLCGSHQILFGIYGERDKDSLQKLGILNEYWTRPGDEYKPKGYEKVENGAYW